MSITDKENNVPVASEETPEQGENQEKINEADNVAPNSGDAPAPKQESTTDENVKPDENQPDAANVNQEPEVGQKKPESGDAGAQVQPSPEAQPPTDGVAPSDGHLPDDEKKSVSESSLSQSKIDKPERDNTSTDAVSSKFAELLDEKDSREGSEGTLEEIIIDNLEGAKSPKPLQIRKQSIKKKEVTYGSMASEERLSEEEEEEEYVWVEEEVDEEIEVETDEESIDEEGEEGKIEEEAEEEERDLEEMETEDVEKVEAEVLEEMAVEEETELYREEIGEELGEPEEVIEDVGEELEVTEEQDILETEIEEKVEEYEGEEVFEELEEVEQEEKGEEIGGREGEEEEEEEEELEEEEEEGIRRKKKRKFKTIKVLRMVRKRKKDVIEQLKQKAKPVDEEAYEIPEPEVDERELDEAEALRKEREKAIDLIKNLVNELILLKKKNKTLSKNIIDYYKQRKMENVQATETPTAEMLRRYYRRLKLFKEFQKANEAERKRLTDELNGMKNKLTALTKEYNDEKAELLNWEAEVGKCVITAQTGKPLEESVVNHLVQRHDATMNQLNQERLSLITLQHHVASKEAAIKDLIALEGNLSLIDYEQLRMDNQMFSDKLEERDNELTHLRKKVLEIIHTQAHVLEKSDALVDSIETYNAQDAKMESEVNDLREKVNKLRKSRDKIREETRKLRRGAGLLIRPKLALDYEESAGKIEYSKHKMDELIKTFKKQKVIIEKLRKEITDATAFNDLF